MRAKSVDTFWHSDTPNSQSSRATLLAGIDILLCCTFWSIQNLESSPQVAMIDGNNLRKSRRQANLTSWCELSH